MQTTRSVDAKGATFNRAAGGFSGRTQSLDESTVRHLCRCHNPKCDCHRTSGRVHCPAHDADASGTPDLDVQTKSGGTVWHCHVCKAAGQQAVTDALLRMARGATGAYSYANGNDGSHTNGVPKSSSKRLDWDADTTTIHNYTDEHGELLFQVGRSGSGKSKVIQQRRPANGEKHPKRRGDWIYELDGVRRVLYGLPDVLRAATVFIVEGEKCADALNQALAAEMWEAGLEGFYFATANPHGAGQWRDTYGADTTGKDVYVLSDNNDVGRQHARQVCASVANRANSVRLVELPGLPNDGDVADFLNSGHHVRDVMQACEAAPMFVAEGEAPAEPRRSRILTSQQLDEIPPPEPIIDGLIYRNTLAMIFGPYGTFKTFQTLGMAEAVAGGHPWQGRQTEKMPVLMIVGEGLSGMKLRKRALEIRHQRPCEVMFLPQAVDFNSADDVDVLLWELMQLEEIPGLVIVETYARCFSGDENKDGSAFVAALDRIRLATGACILVNHHAGKDGTLRGDSKVPSAMDTIIEAKKQNNTITLRCEKQKDAAEFETFSLESRVVELGTTDRQGRPLTSLVFEPSETVQLLAPPSKAEATREKIIAELQGEPLGLTYGEWQGRCSFIGETAFYNHLKELRDKQRRVKLDANTNRYFVTSPTSLHFTSVKSEVQNHFTSLHPPLEGEGSEVAPAQDNGELIR